MKRFKSLNNIFGWVAFAIAAATYLLTMEPTASFWDCPEFISAAFKLDVGHPPGAPFFMLMGHFFSLFAKDTAHVALLVNSLTALCSAFTILFLFWTITHLARKIVIKSDEDYTTGNVIAILGAGMVGALAYTFSDTFWFSAVEAEVYGFSSLFTAIVFWLILKWEDVADEPGSDRWLIFIAYMMGLSIGVHILNLLAIPVLVLVYYFRKHTPSVKGTIIALLTGVVLLAAVLYGLIPGFIEVAGWFELLFVNKFGLGFNTGLYAYVVLTLGFLVWGVYESYINKNYWRMVTAFTIALSLVGVPFFGGRVILGIIIIAGLGAFFYFKKSKVNARWLNTILLMISMVTIGYSSYAVIVIRSSANPTMDQNNPDNVFTLKSYLNRDQYGDAEPLLYGPVYNAPVKWKVDGNSYVPEMKQGDAIYSKKPKTSASDKDEYIVTGYKTDYVKDDKFMMFFPRMYSDQESHINAYKVWGQIEGESVDYDYAGQQKSDIKPTFSENLKFFFEYQVNFMYIRYFMWNFSGRQNDMQSYGELEHGNWITGIGFIDNALVGDQTKLPTELKENKGHNTYFMLPLLLGILGMIFMIYGGKKGIEGFWLTFFLFIITGLAIVVYLNQTPYQPRERDYAYAGSFYAFCIWIGFGVLALYRGIEKYAPKLSRTTVSVLVTLVGLGVPALLAQQNWDDHDRSNRYTCRDFGQNYLESLKPNAIIFTNGDNDTFPLWYNQEVEGNRTDVRVCNLSYLQTDWYIEQMQREAYKSAPLPISWQPKDYVTGKNEAPYVEDVLKKPLDVKTAFDFLLSSDPATKISGEPFIPTKQLYIPVNAQEVIKNGALPASRASEILPQIDINLNKRITKSELMILEMLKENNWKRPIYFAVSVGESNYLGLSDHFELTGLAYQVLPVGVKGAGNGVNVVETYDNMMNKFKYGNISDPKVYLDENVLHMCMTHRVMFSQLIWKLLAQNDSVRALKALDYCNKMIPGTTVRHDYSSIRLGEAYYKLHKTAQGNAIMDAIAKNSMEYLTWYFSLNTQLQNSVSNKIGEKVYILQQVLRVCDESKQKVILDKYLPFFMECTKRVKI